MKTESMERKLREPGFDIPAIERDHEGRLRGGFLTLTSCNALPDGKNGECGCKEKAQCTCKVGLCDCNKAQCVCKEKAVTGGEDIWPGSSWRFD